MGIDNYIMTHLCLNLPCMKIYNIPGSRSISVIPRLTFGLPQVEYLIEITDKTISLYRMVPIEITQSGTVTRQRENKPREVWHYQ